MNVDIRVATILVVGLAAVVEDLKSRTISNWTTGGALLAGLVIHAWRNGWHGLGHAALGAVLGFVVFLVFFLLGGMGGGDIKLMTGFGALLGGLQSLWAAFWTAFAGGIFAMVFLAVRGIWRWARGIKGSPSENWSESIPYGPAIAVGALLALVSEF